jgi:hypothetical protein
MELLVDTWLIVYKLVPPMEANPEVPSVRDGFAVA